MNSYTPKKSLSGMHKDKPEITILQGNQVINARDLHQFLDVRTRFNDWIVRQINEIGFIENTDFYSNLSISIGRPQKEYFLTIDTAKHIALSEKTEKGKEYRQYLIDFEKNHKETDVGKIAFVHNILTILKYLECHKPLQNDHLEQFKKHSRKIRQALHKEFHDYRNNALGLHNAQLKEVVLDLFNSGQISKPQYKNKEHRIFAIDRYKFIEIAVFDLLMSKGNLNEHQVLSFAKLCYEVAKAAQINILPANEDNLFQEKEEGIHIENLRLLITGKNLNSLI